MTLFDKTAYFTQLNLLLVKELKVLPKNIFGSGCLLCQYVHLCLASSEFDQ